MADRERDLWGYLLLPRPGDLVKAWIFPVAFVLGALAAGGVGSEELLRAVLTWVALELLIYQARYQWNDIRGFDADQRHPDAIQRGRLPGPSEKGRERKRASALVAAARLAVVALLALLPGLGLSPLLAALTASVFGIAFLYEWLRSRATGYSEQAPPPLRPALIALWLVAGGGYAIRGVAGLGLGFGLAGRPGLAFAATLATWCFGIAFVTGRWTLEALPFGRLGAAGQISWEVEAGQAREHSLALVRWLPSRVESDVRRLDEWQALRRRPRLSAPWNLAAIAAAGAAAASGLLLASPAGLPAVLVSAACGSLLALAVLVSSRPLLGWALAAFVLGLFYAALGSPREGIAVLPWCVILGAHLFFASQSPSTLSRPRRGATLKTGPRWSNC